MEDENHPTEEVVNPQNEETVIEDQEANHEGQNDGDDPQQEDNSDALHQENEGQEPEAEEQPVEEQQPRKKSRVSERIRQLNEQRRVAEERAARAEARLKELQAPQDDEFDEFDINSVVERSSRNTAALMQEQAAAEAKEEATRIENQTNVERLKGFQEAEQQFMEKVPDYEQVTGQLNAIAQNEAVAGIILDSEKGPEVAYYLGRHPNEAREVATMSPIEAAKYIGGIEARLTPPAPKRATNAPKPLPKVTGKSGSKNKSPSDMSFAEYEKWRSGGN